MRLAPAGCSGTEIVERAGGRLEALRRRKRQPFLPDFHDLERRMMPLTFTVNTTADSGAGSLRQAITDSNATPGSNTIDFGIGAVGSQQTIALASPLPAIADPVLIDGWSQGGSGYDSAPLIGIDGSGAGSGSHALLLSTGSDGSTIRGLDIDNFVGGVGIGIASTDNSVEGSYLGIDLAGQATGSLMSQGIAIQVGSNTIGGTAAGQGNVVANAGYGIGIGGGSDNLIQGNLIGTDPTGTVGVIVGYGLIVGGGTNGNTIGGTVAGAGNLITDSVNDNVVLDGSDNLFEGNRVGTDITGTTSLTSSATESWEISGSGNTVGGTAAGAGNLISGNGGGLAITGSDNLVEGNFVGTNAAGTAALANGSNGVAIDSGASGNTIGGTITGAGNLISGNGDNGVLVLDASGNLIAGNLIGTDKTGSISLGNDYNGIELDSSSNDTVGGTTAAARNVISASGEFNVYLLGSSDETVQGNDIGTDATGAFALDTSTYAGMEILSSSDNLIGGTAAGAGNVVSGNGLGILVADYDDVNADTTVGNTIQGNLIGLNAGGTAAIPNGNVGIVIEFAEDTEVGGTAAGAGNVIAGTTAISAPGSDYPAGSNGAGIFLEGPTPGTIIQDNRIGTNESGTAAVPNQGSGVFLQTSTATISGNEIAGNGYDGITVQGDGTPNGLSGLWTADGTTFDGYGLDGTLLGGATYAPGLSGQAFSFDGVSGAFQDNSAFTPPQGRIEYDSGATMEAWINTTRNNWHADDRRRRHRYAERHGLVPSERPPGRDRQQGDRRPVQLRVDQPRHDQRRPVAPGCRHLERDHLGRWRDVVRRRRRGRHRHRAGHHRQQRQLAPVLRRRPQPAAALLSGTDGRGRRLQPAARRQRHRHDLQSPRRRPVRRSAATITGNLIGTNAAGTAALGNGHDGVDLVGSSVNTIGGTTAGAGNLISGNASDGVGITGPAATGNVLEGNLIGTDVTGSIAVPDGDGVLVEYGASSNTIGGLTTIAGTGAGNVISGNRSSGIVVGATESDSTTTNNVIEGNLIGTDVTGEDPLANDYGVDSNGVGTTIGGTAAGGSTSSRGIPTSTCWSPAARPATTWSPGTTSAWISRATRSWARRAATSRSRPRATRSAARRPRCATSSRAPRRLGSTWIIRGPPAT